MALSLFTFYCQVIAPFEPPSQSVAGDAYRRGWPRKAGGCPFAVRREASFSIAYCFVAYGVLLFCSCSIK